VWGFTKDLATFREILQWLLGGHRELGNGMVSMSPSSDRNLVKLAGAL
jgi:hypothetical protein